MDQGFYDRFGVRLRQRREAIGITQSEVAGRTGMTRPAITNTESGKQRVLLHQAVDIASALGSRLADLLPGDGSGAPSSMPAEPPLTAAAIHRLRQEEVESTGSVRADYARVREKAAELVMDLTDPPVDVEALAAKLGAEILRVELDPDVAGFLFRSATRRVIVANSRDGETRLRFTIGHELGHLLLHRPEEVHIDSMALHAVSRRESGSTGVVPEVEANAFSANVLMPADWLRADLDKDEFDLSQEGALERLAQRYNVSVQAMAFRIGSLMGQRS